MGNSKDDRLVEVRVTIAADHLELLCDFITNEICTGLVLDDEKNRQNPTVLFYSMPGEVEGTVATLRGFLSHLLGVNSDFESLVSTQEIDNVTWEDEYRRSVKPVRIGPDILIRPPWTNAAVDVKYLIVIEPKMAFGTGTHETTRTCLQIMRDRLRPGNRFLDLGCGSGILSIMADKLGAAYIKAIDYDVQAVENASDNFEINAVSAPHEIVFGSIEKAADDQPYDFVCANIIKSTILDLLPRLLTVTASPGTLLLSGLLEVDLEDLCAALDKLSVTDYDIIEDNEWRTLRIPR